MRTVLVFFLFYFPVTVDAQELGQVNMAGGSDLSNFSLLTDRDVLIRISPDGKILEWGTEVQSFRSNNFYARGLQPYPGRVEYYGPEADSISRGKVKSIGSSVITYFEGYETKEKIGKIRSVGRLFFDYYGPFDHKMLQGRIKLIGTTLIDYYSVFDDQSVQGKLKSIGSIVITYYTSFDDKLIRGKVKSIGGISYSWYTSLDRQGLGGYLKSGPFRQNIGGVVYIVQ